MEISGSDPLPKQFCCKIHTMVHCSDLKLTGSISVRSHRPSLLEPKWTTGDDRGGHRCWKQIIKNKRDWNLPWCIIMSHKASGRMSYGHRSLWARHIHGRTSIDAKMKWTMNEVMNANEEWAKIPAVRCRSLTDWSRNRLAAGIAEKGCGTKYYPEGTNHFCPGLFY